MNRIYPKRKVAAGGITVQSEIKDVPKKGYCSGWVKSKVVGPGDGEGARVNHCQSVLRRGMRQLFAPSFWRAGRGEVNTKYRVLQDDESKARE